MIVYLINTPSDFLLDDKSQPPLGLLYIHSFLQKSGINVSIIDLAGQHSEEWKIPSNGDIYGITAVTPQFDVACQIAERVKTDNNLVVLGGVHGSCRPKESLQLGKFDIVVTFEGEETMLEIAQGKPLEDIKGICYKNGKQIVENPGREPQKNIDLFPYPVFDAIDMGSYHTNVLRTSKDILYGGLIITSRGCPHRCAFCCSPYTFKRKVRFHSIEYIKQWTDDLKQHGYTSFNLCDDTILLGMSRLQELCNLLCSGGYIWRAQIRGDVTTRDKLQLMYGSGCRQVDIGVESGSQRILDMVYKDESVETNGQAIEYAHLVGLKVKALLIVGLPGETQEDLDMTKNFLRQYRPDGITIGTFIPYPGCDIANNPSKYNYFVDPQAPYSKYLLSGKERVMAPISNSKIINEMTADFRRQILDVAEELGINI
jgi:radical SAM superfamily enzyme YgiQ (UPF0313 family)